MDDDKSSNESNYDRISPDECVQHGYDRDINFDLSISYQCLGSSHSGIPILADSFDDSIFGNTKFINIEAQSSMDNPYLLLECVASTIFAFIVCSNIFVFAYIASQDQINNHDIVDHHIVAILTNFTYDAVVPYIFVTTSTYKSVNVLLEYLMVNVIIFQYDFVTILKYILAHIVSAFVGAMLSFGLLYEYSNHLTMDQILPPKFDFNYSYIIITVLTHISIAVCITVISNNVSSLTAKKSSVYKALVLLASGLMSGYIIGPSGHTLPRVCLYTIMLIDKKQTEQSHRNSFVAHIVTMLCIIIAYPLIAIQIKVFWKNKYQRYIEYGH